MKLMLAIREHLERVALRGMAFTEDSEQRAIRGYTFLTAKPMIYALNLGGGGFLPAMLGRLPVEERDGVLLVNGNPTIAFQGKLEEEIAQLPAEEVAVPGRDGHRPAAHRLIAPVVRAGRYLLLHRGRRRVPRVDHEAQRHR